MKRKKPKTYIAPVESGFDTDVVLSKIPKTYIKISRKKLEEGKKQKVKVTPPTTPKKILKERKPTEKRKLVKESTSTLSC